MERKQYERMHHFEESNWWFRLKRDFAYGLLLEGLRDGVGRFEDLRIADVGSGTGMVLLSLPLDALVVGFELDVEALSFSRERGLSCLVRASAEEIPAASGTFDAVLCLDVLEHVDRDVEAMKEICRILRPGGYAVVSVPAHPALWSPHDVVLHHRRRYRREALQTKLESAGLHIVRLTYGFATALPIAAAVRPVRRILSRWGECVPPSDDFVDLPTWVEAALYLLCRWEVPLVRRGLLPVGVSLMALCRAGEMET